MLNSFCHGYTVEDFYDFEIEQLQQCEEEEHHCDIDSIQLEQKLKNLAVHDKLNC